MQRPKFEDTDLFDLSAKQKAYTLYGLLWGDSNYHQDKKPSIEILRGPQHKDFLIFIKSLADYWDLKTKYEEPLGRLRIYLSPPMRRHYDKFSRLINVKGDKIVSSYATSRINHLGLFLWWIDTARIQKPNTKDAYGEIKLLNLDYPSSLNLKKCLTERFNTKAELKGSKETGFNLYISNEELKNLTTELKDYLPFIPTSSVYSMLSFD